ncbi:phosphonate C-P lyase system protein PhnL [Paenibacillus glycinis]|uniref:Phosphonate C-P lyase system protein PhnL n=1 Tax=Paenibacillus glycinis TaxID=2697035 RepID=A0ABW9XMP0_9BACL|nr:phosphonate C-P lyase system protein PhnL [Paenibacillus glycinis]NBD23667.1 phosphonate C-P lyase system protein PhnL [Paenibacillus glycinis]
MLEVVNLTKSFELHVSQVGKVYPIQGLSFHIRQGRFLGIAGPSGIGKSTILKCIFRTYMPSSGEVWYDSLHEGRVDLAQADDRQMIRLRERELGYVSQFLKVIPRVPAVDIVAERLLPLGWSQDDARREAERMLERLRIPRKLWQAFPATFSGGEQQRVNLARAFIVRPRLMILDEPTASLDRETTSAVIEMLQAMKREGTTMVGIFHDWDVMEQVADEILDITLSGGGTMRPKPAAAGAQAE